MLPQTVYRWDSCLDIFFTDPQTLNQIIQIQFKSPEPQSILGEKESRQQTAGLERRFVIAFYHDADVK